MSTNPQLPPLLPVNDDEQLLGIAYAVLLPLLNRLAIRPFDRTAQTEMLFFLDRLGERTAAAWDRLTERTSELGISTHLFDAVLFVEEMGDGQ